MTTSGAMWAARPGLILIDGVVREDAAHDRSSLGFRELQKTIAKRVRRRSEPSSAACPASTARDRSHRRSPACY